MKQRWRKILTGVMVPAMLFCSIPLTGLPVFAERADEAAWQVKPSDIRGELHSTVVCPEEADADGFLFHLEDSAELLDDALPEGVETVPFTDGTYTAETLDQILDFVPEEDIEYIEPNYTVYLQDAEAVPDPEADDPYYQSGAQWNLEDIHAGSAWELGLEGQDRDTAADMDYDGNAGNDDVIVAVIDSGINPEHEDFASGTLLEGQTFLSGTTDARDALGHGTLIAGIIASSRDNAAGIAGIAEHVKILPLRVFDRGNTSLSTITSAINYAVSQKQTFDSSSGKNGTNISVLNMSLGFSHSSTELQNAVNQAIDAGIIVICSAGNAGTTAANYPAQYAIGVGATDQSGAAASFSQRLSKDNGEGYENKLWVTAPGKTIIGPYYYSSEAYMTDSGTSFAAPQAAALAAVCKGIDNSMTHSQFRQLLKDTAAAAAGTSGDIDGQDVEFGWGRLDFAKTIDYLLAQKTGSSKVTVTVRNENGTALTGASVRLFACAEDGSAGAEVKPDTSGKYSLTLGKKYLYRASAGANYPEQEGKAVLLASDSRLLITLRSQVYPTRFIVQDSEGNARTDAAVTLQKNARKILEPSGNGSYPTGDGSYSYSVSVTGLPAAEGSFTLDNVPASKLEDGVNVVRVMLDGYVSRSPSCTDEGEAVVNGKAAAIPALGHDYGTDGLCTRCGAGQPVPSGDPTVKIAGSNISLTELKRLGKTAYLFYWPNNSSYYDRRVEGVFIKDLVEKYGNGSRCVRQIMVTTAAGETKYYPVTWFQETMLAWNIDGQDIGTDGSNNGFRMAVNDGNDSHWANAPVEIAFTYRNHSYEGDPVTVPATCGTDGYTKQVCSVCGHETRTNVVSATGEHSWDGGRDLYDKNGKATGAALYFCTVCGETRIERSAFPVETVPMFRLYNPNSGEHFYTGSEEERDNLVGEGWNYEGIAWNAPVTSSKPVYRLYNAYAGDHHYTLSAGERDELVAAGWRYEGVCWNSWETGESGGEALYRLYNPNAYQTGGSGAHHYTRSQEERDYLVSLGWRDERIAWYGAAWK